MQEATSGAGSEGAGSEGAGSERGVTSVRRQAAVLGHPIAHSLSPVLHRAAYRQLGLVGWHYEAIDVSSSELADFMDSLGADSSLAPWAGLSLTMPLKETVIPLLDEIAPNAEQTRAVNTVVFEDGRRHGSNTDITGLAGIVSDSSSRNGPPMTATVIGAGATARSAISALGQAGVNDVMVSSRRPETVEQLLMLAARCGLRGSPGAWPPGEPEFSPEVVISTVPASAFSGDGSSRGVEAVQLVESPNLLVDVIYDPWPTPLALAWQAAGGHVVGGLELLVRQAVEQVHLMTGLRPDIEGMRAAGEAALVSRAGATDIAQAEQ